jgi:hypothetical protein
MKRSSRSPSSLGAGRSASFFTYAAALLEVELAGVELLVELELLVETELPVELELPVDLLEDLLDELEELEL